MCFVKIFVYDLFVLILDEFVSGLDLWVCVEVKVLFKEFCCMGKMIFIFSYIFIEFVDCCILIGIIECGEMLMYGLIVDVY